MDTLTYDFVVIGSGLAGSTVSLLLSELGTVALLDKGEAYASNSYLAQGGMATAVALDDSPELHLQDTLLAGDGLCHPTVVRELVSCAPALLQWLTDLDVIFDRDYTGQVALGLEGAHSRSRILHVGGDATGANILRTLTQNLAVHPQITRFANTRVDSLLYNEHVVHGALVHFASGRDILLRAQHATILATGGIGQLFAHTTNPLCATGDGIALAHQAGAHLRNLEFVQFHPTALNRPTNPQFLISEAVRGAGAKLLDATGYAIMADHPQGDLAPRDVVARRIDQIRKGGRDVYLDAQAIPDFATRFPTIYRTCKQMGLDPNTSPLPVSPAAHFAMGGIASSLAGETSVRGLFAIGEVANTGVHGANRLASNSLLECIVMAHKLAVHLRQHRDMLPRADLNVDTILKHRFKPIVTHVLMHVQEIMWKLSGVVRHHDSLLQGIRQLQDLQTVYPRQTTLTTALLIMQSAYLRKESRGAHFRIDFPMHDPTLTDQDTWSNYSEMGE